MAEAQHSRSSARARPQSQRLSELVSIRLPEEARESVKILTEWADADEKRLRMAVRAATSAANRAKAATKRKALSDRERRELVRVEDVYRRFIARASRRLGRLGKRTRAPGPGGKTIFFPAKNKTLADIITIRSPAEARAAIRQLDEWADDDPDRVRKAIWSATLAANRAEVSTRRRIRPLSPKEKHEMLQVAQLYRRAVRRLHERLDELKSGARTHAARHRIAA